MEVKITDYGLSEDPKKYYVKYRVFGIDKGTLDKLENKIEDKTEVKSGELVITIYFDEGYFPFGSDESRYRRQDFIAREEIEMTAYLLSILED